MVDIIQTSKSKKTYLIDYDLGQEISKTLENKSAINIVSIDLAGKSDLADKMIIASGTSTTHIGALADHVVRTFKNHGVEILSIEGQPANRWVLVDSSEIIVHIFHPEEREIYNLEKMWNADFSDDLDSELLH